MVVRYPQQNPEPTRKGKIRPLPLTSKQCEFRRSPAWVRGFVAGRGSGKTVIGALDVLLRARNREPWMGVSPSYSIIHETTLPTVIAEARRLQVLVRFVKSPLPRVMFRTQDGGQADIVLRSGDDPEKLRGASKAGLWIDEGSICTKAVFELGMACLRHEGRMGPLVLTFTPRGRRHWTFDVFYERLDLQENQWIEEDEQTGQEWCCWVTDDSVLCKREIHRFSEIPYLRRANSHLVHAHTLENPFLPEEFYRNIRAYYTSQLAAQELAGQFVEIEGLLFRRSWFPTVMEVPSEAVRVRYWDRASSADSGDYSAGVLLARDRRGVFFIEDVVRGRWSAHDRNTIMRDTARRDARRYGNEVIIVVEQEGGSGGKEVAQQAQIMLAGHPIYNDVVSGTRYKMKDHVRTPGSAKIVRAQPLAAAAERGDVRLKLGAWNTEYLDELLAFPEFAYDDQVDASSGAFNRLCKLTDFVAGACVRTMVDASRVASEKYGVNYERRPMTRPSDRKGNGRVRE